MAIADRREREKVKRRTEILNAAEQFFFSRGYDEVSMDDIARKAELNKATLYLYFRNKEALFTAIVLRGLMRWRDMIRNADQEENKGIDRLATIGNATFTFVKQYPEYYRLYNFFRSGRFDMEQITNNDDLKEIHVFFQEIFIISNNAIETGIEDGSIRSDIDPVELAVLLTTMSDSINNLSPAFKSKLEARGINQERFVNDFIDFVYHMIENPKKKGRHKKDKTLKSKKESKSKTRHGKEPA